MLRLIVVSCFVFLFFVMPSSVFAATIKINEFSSAAGSSSDSDWPDWVEIYYEGVDVNLYRLVDAANNQKELSGASCSGNFCTVDWSNRLDGGGDVIKLELLSAPGTGVDQVGYGSSGSDVSAPGTSQSAGRQPDATGGWVVFSTPTKSGTNNSAPLAPTPTPTPTLTPTPTQQTPTNTPTPTSTPTPTTGSAATATPTRVPTKKPTPTLTKEPEEEIFVLGAEDTSVSTTPTQEAIVEATASAQGKNWKTPVLAGILIIAGISLIGFSAYSFLAKGKTDRII